MNWDLAIRIFYIGCQIMLCTALLIGLIASACVLGNFIATKGWSDEVKPPRSWKKGDKSMAEKWGSEWEKLQKLKTKRKQSRL